MSREWDLNLFYDFESNKESSSGKIRFMNGSQEWVVVHDHFGEIKDDFGEVVFGFLGVENGIEVDDSGNE